LGSLDVPLEERREAEKGTEGTSFFHYKHSSNQFKFVIMFGSCDLVVTTVYY